MPISPSIYKKAGIIFIVLGVILFLIPSCWNFTQCWYVPIALEKGLIFIVIGVILSIVGGRSRTNWRAGSEGPKG
jgi:hypothetical protein